MAVRWRLGGVEENERERAFKGCWRAAVAVAGLEEGLCLSFDQNRGLCHCFTFYFGDVG